MYYNLTVNLIKKLHASYIHTYKLDALLKRKHNSKSKHKSLKDNIDINLAYKT